MNEQIREFLKNNQPIPATEKERASIMRISKKTIYIMMFLVVILLVICVKESFNMKVIEFGAYLLAVVGALLVLLEVKDKIRYKLYDKIYSTYVYVESGFYVNRAFHIVVSYYDYDYGMFNKTKMHIDGVDVRNQQIAAGAVIRVLVGEKNSKIHYIKMKSFD